MKKLISLLLLLSFLAFDAAALLAQMDSEFVIANQLMRQRRYEQAYPILKKLIKDNPNSYSMYQQFMECLINLKKYDEAISLSENRIKNNTTPLLTQTQLGKVYHIQGDTTAAYNTWNNALEQGTNNLQIYLTISRVMRERREYTRSIETLKKARKQASNIQLFRSEIISTYLMAGQYDNAMDEMVQYIIQQPERISYVQRVLMRFEDEFLYDTGILEIEEAIDQMNTGDKGLAELYDLQLWLLLERNLYRRAYATALRYERDNRSAIYTLYNLAHKLESERKYKLAEKALLFYADKPDNPLYENSQQRLAGLYINWADHLSSKNLGRAGKTDSLYRAANERLQLLIDKYPSYSNITEVIITKTEIAVENFSNIEEAERLLDDLKNYYAQSDNPNLLYLEGRIKMYKKQYNEARILLTRAKKKARIGEVADKASYYLSLNDFYAGDFEFAKIQLSALEKEHTSNYANDALQLRIWIQDGLKHDTTGTYLIKFSLGVKAFQSEDFNTAYNHLDSLIHTEMYPPLKDDAALLISEHARTNPAYYTKGYQVVSNVLQSLPATPLKERLLWEKARLGDLIYHHSGNTLQGNKKVENLPSTLDELIKLYEVLIIEHPDGFYASPARKRITELQKHTSS